jgi:rhodanese-related sulfurtransferase
MRAVERLGVSRVLVVCRDVAHAELSSVAEAAVVVVYTSADLVDQQSTPFPAAYLESCLVSATPEVQRAAIHQAVQHLDRGGALAMGVDLDAEFAGNLVDLGLTREDHTLHDDVVIYRRSERTTVHDLLWDARAMIERVAADDLAVELGGSDAPLVIDTRTHTDRCRMGVIAGSVHVPRTVLEWHLDPANGYTHPAIGGFDHPLVVVCNGGYSSSLGAANLVRLGFTDVRDLIGGVRAWIHRGLPVEPPDHAHLDL